MALGIVAHIAFWLVLVIGARGMGARRTVLFVVLWATGYVGAHWITSGDLYFVAFVAALDIALVLLVFKSDVRLT